MKKELEQRYNTLSNELVEMEKIKFMLQHKGLAGDAQFDKLKQKISSYQPADKDIESRLSIAKAYIRSGEGLLSKNMDGGVTTYSIALSSLKNAEKELGNHKKSYKSEEINKVKEEIANFSEALARRIRQDVEKKDNEYSLKKDFSNNEKRELQDYEQKLRAKALKVAEDAVNYAKKLMKD